MKSRPFSQLILMCCFNLLYNFMDPYQKKSGNKVMCI